MNIRHSAGKITALTALALLAFAPRPAHAQLVMSTTPSSASAGGTGALDVILTDTGGTFNIGGFSFEVAVPGGSGITFTNADFSTTSPYIFAGNSFDAIISLPLNINTLPDTFVDGNDDATVGGTTLNVGDVFGLGHLTYAVDPGAGAGPVTVSFNDIGGLTSLSDPNGNPITVGATNGTITITPSGAPTPEPSQITVFAIFALGLGGLWARARRKSLGA